MKKYNSFFNLVLPVVAKASSSFLKPENVFSKAIFKLTYQNSMKGKVMKVYAKFLRNNNKK